VTVPPALLVAPARVAESTTDEPTGMVEAESLVEIVVD
jgi:hypothetical protein